MRNRVGSGFRVAAMPRTVLLVWGMLACLGGLASGRELVEIARFAAAPVIDGALDDAVWQSAAPLTLRNYREGPLVNATHVRLGYDERALYVAARCEEAAMSQLRTAWRHAEERDSAIWQDDCFEIFLDPLARGTATGIHIVVNSAAVWYDAWDGDRDWDCGGTAQVRLEDAAWTIEVAIPFQDLGFTPQGGESWLLNLGREQKPLGELSCLGQGTGNFGNAERYVEARFAGGGPVQVKAIAAAGQDQVQLAITNPDAATSTYHGRLELTRDGRRGQVEERTLDAPPGGTVDLLLPYKAEPGSQSLTLTVRSGAADGPELYRNTVEVRKPGAKPRTLVWQLDDPLYDELLSDQPTGLVRDGAMYWFPEIDHGRFWQFALQYGAHYVKDEVYTMLAEQRLRPLHNSYVLTTDAFRAFEHYRRHGIKAVLYPKPFGASLPEGVPGAFLLDPAFVEAYLEDVRRTLAEYGDVIWAVNLGDEVINHVEAAGISLFAEHREAYPYIVQVDAEVRQEFGFGRYGIPESKADPNAFRWIAYRRWLTTRLNDLLLRLADTVRTTRPGVWVISDDPVAFHHALDFGAWKGHADIVTHQLYPRRDANFPAFGFWTKLLADLSGVEEVWPCPHVEEYGVSYTPEEVLEQLSQVVRNGGTGFHLYLADTVGRRKGKRGMMNEFYGAPDRWQVITAALAEMRRSRRLRFPQPDAAIFYSSDSVAAYPDRMVSDKIPCQYTFTGPVARGALQFVDEYRVEREPNYLSRFKVVYIPDGSYLRPSAAAAIEAYAAAGGIVVATDPEILSHAPDGSSAAALRERLFGVRLGETSRRRSIDWQGQSLPLTSAAYTIEVQDGTEVMARFDDGAPAIVRRPLGRGQCWYFASNPCTRKALAEASWKRFFTDLHASLGAGTGHDIWRFRFPASLIQEPERPRGRCLTNNNLTWRSFKPLPLNNVDTGGSYSYSLYPDSIRDNGGRDDIPFAMGDLTDRRLAPEAGDVLAKNSRLQDWVVRYATADAFNIRFDFGGIYEVDRVRILHSGPLPDVRIETSTDGETWQNVGGLSARDTGSRDVAGPVVTFAPTKARFVRLDVAARQADSMLMLSEIEIWGP